MANPPITITVNYNPNATGKKVTVSDDVVHVPLGENTINWVLGTVPSNTTLAFIDNWHPHSPFTAPDPDASNSFTGTDNNTNEGEAPVVFTYDVFLLHNCVPVPKDPEIENDPGGHGTGQFSFTHQSK